MARLGFCLSFERYFGNLNKNGQYSVFQKPQGDDKIRFLIENTTLTVYIQTFDYGITVIFEIFNGNMVA